MIRLLFFLLAMAGVGFLAAWVASNPGEVSMIWLNYRIEMSMAVLLAFFCVALFAFTFLVLLVRKLIAWPGEFSRSRRQRHYQHGLIELTHAVAAMVGSDMKMAEIHTRKAQRLLGRVPLTLLISAQIARNRGDSEKTQLLLEQMLQHKETEYLAARYLSEAASQQQQYPRALTLARRAQALQPKDENAGNAIVDLNIRLGQWQEAQAAITKAARKGAYPTHAAMRRHQSLVTLAQANALLSDGALAAALRQAKLAHKFQPDFVPAILTLAQAMIANDQPAQAIKLLARACEHAPHPQLIAELQSLSPKAQNPKTWRRIDEGAVLGTAWMCGACGQPSIQWKTHCPACQAFDTLEWR